ncbi:13528_t:CDS:1, partial [Funneliformis geosporum]
EFITEDMWKQLLHMHLKATDQQKLRKNLVIITKLGLFVRTVIKTVLIAMRTKDDTKMIIKKCDKDTIDLEIPTKLGIIRVLPVRELLDY